jgi:hypothetical protein
MKHVVQRFIRVKAAVTQTSMTNKAHLRYHARQYGHEIQATCPKILSLADLKDNKGLAVPTVLESVRNRVCSKPEEFVSYLLHGHFRAAGNPLSVVLCGAFSLELSPLPLGSFGSLRASFLR